MRLVKVKSVMNLPLFLTLLGAVICAGMLMDTSCSHRGTPTDKASSLLNMQIELRKTQISSANSERLEQMKAMGMNTDNLNVQRVFIYFREMPTTSQAVDLQALGIILYLDSWIPRVGAHPAGFLLADMPIDKLNDLASRDYVVRVDSAEQLAQPQSPEKPM